MISGVGRHFGLAGWLCGTNSLDLVCKCFLGCLELKTLNFFLRNQYNKKAFTRKKGNSQFSHESDCFLFFQAAFEDEEESQYFDSEDVFQQLNYEANDFGDDSGSDRDDDLVSFLDFYWLHWDVGCIVL